MEEYLRVSKNGGIPNGLFIRENPIQMDENWGYPYFRQPPNPHLNNFRSRHVPQSFINIPGFYLRPLHVLQKSIHIPKTAGQFLPLSGVATQHLFTSQVFAPSFSKSYAFPRFPLIFTSPNLPSVARKFSAAGRPGFHR